ncbi:Probable sulfate transporter 3.5 [Dionaea muscipula]
MDIDPAAVANNNNVVERKVNLSNRRSFWTTLKSDLKETFFPEDPFKKLSVPLQQPRLRRARTIVEYYVPVFEWLPRYNLKLLRYDLLAGITIASLAIPQGISYANLAKLPPIIGLYSSFVPAIVYTVFGSSQNLAVGTVAACSLLLAETIGEKVKWSENPILYLHLVFTATLFTGIFQTALGLLRLGFLVDFLSHSTITGFMGGTAIIIILQQLKGFLGFIHFTQKTDAISVLHFVFANRKEWHWQSAIVGTIFLSFLLFSRYLKNKNPKLFWVSAVAPLATVVIGCLFAYLAHGEKHGIQIVGHLKKGINPPSMKDLNFDRRYIAAPIKAGIITGILALAEGIAIARSFGILKNQQVDGNKEMIAFGLMNIVGSLTSCYLTTGPFSKTAVNVNAGCKTQMSNLVMAVCMMLTLLLLAPLFSYTPLVALSAIIMSSMFGLIDYHKAYLLFKVDKYDFLICMAAFFGVAFISMDIGLGLSVGLAIVRSLLYAARPESSKLGNIPGTEIYRDIKQYPVPEATPGILVLQLSSPIYFSGSTYVRERVMRWIRDEEAIKGSPVEDLILDLGGVTAIDVTGIETFFELKRLLDPKGIKMLLVNPRMQVVEKMMASNFISTLGEGSVFLTIADAAQACKFRLNGSSKNLNEHESADHVV